jgi:riboflavin kinase / FMN adenylyltransferase
MQVFRTSPPVGQRAPSAVTIGNFDGVHRGHQAMLAQLVQTARARGLRSTVLTFEPHPREYFAQVRGDASLAPARIASLRDRILGLKECGIDQVCVAHFHQAFASVSAERFITDILHHNLNAQYVLVGDDFRFGAKRQGDFALLKQHAKALGFDLASMQTQLEDGERISSSAVRAALANGDLMVARRLMGGPYCISGHVVHGKKLGRQWQFPTLNLRLPYGTRTAGRHNGRPALSGIFVVQVHGLANTPIPAVASLGTRPAVEDNGVYLLETHCLDFNQEVYGKIVRVEFLQKLRDEANFDSLTKMVEQIQLDAASARRYFASHHIL